MERVQADEPEAFGVLYDRFATRAHGLAFAISRNRTRAEDVVQEAFLSLWRTRARYDPVRGAVAAWVLATVRNRALDSLRRDGRHDSRRADGDGDDTTDRLTADGDVAAATVERDEAATLRGALATLPEAQRDVIALAYFGELSTSEIAAELELPLGTVKGRMRLGLQKLRHEDLAR
jgi:RNA polymerase sigma-70 factor (ECF subfamily)